MSNQNNDNSGIAIVFGLIGAAAIFMAAAIFALAAFAALVLTILALCAWDRPRTMFGETLHPHEARAFVKRGLLGMVLLPVFVIFCALLFNFDIVDQAWVYLLIGGYTLGSVGVEYLQYQAEQDAGATATYIQPTAAPLPQPKESAPPQPQSRERFTFASWDDEEEPR